MSTFSIKSKTNPNEAVDLAEIPEEEKKDEEVEPVLTDYLETEFQQTGQGVSLPPKIN